MKTTLRFIVSVALVGMMLALPGSALAQDSIRNVRISETYTFGDTIFFDVQAQATTVFTYAALTLTVEGLAEPVFLTPEIGRSALLSANHPVNVAQYAIPPFAEITYWWDLATLGGKTHTTDPVTFRYEDNRVGWEWRVNRNKNVVVHWDGEAQAVPQIAQTVALESLARADNLLGTVTSGDAHIYVYPDAASLNAAWQSHQTAQIQQGWAQAVTLPDLPVVLVSAAPGPALLEDLSRDLPHEMAHVAIGQATRQNEAAMIPGWFSEGVAAANALAFDSQLALMLQDGLDAGTLLPVAGLCAPSFATLEADMARLAYAQSASLMAYIRVSYGDAAITSLFDAYKNGAACEAGIQQALGTSMVELESGWRSSLARESLARPSLSGSLVVWLVVMSVGLFTGILFWIPLARRPVRRQRVPNAPTPDEDLAGAAEADVKDEYTPVKLTDKQAYWKATLLDDDQNDKGMDNLP